MANGSRKFHIPFFRCARSIILIFCRKRGILFPHLNVAHATKQEAEAVRLSQEEWETIGRSRLFTGIPPEKLPDTLSCLHARRETYRAGDYVLREGEQTDCVGLVLSGHARSLKLDRQGEPLIVTLLERGSFLGILLAASRERKSPVAVQAQDTLDLLLLPAETLLFPCGNSCGDRALLLRNFLDSVAEQSLTLNDRIGCLLCPTIREKVTAYLSRVSAEKGTPAGEGGWFSIPLDRNAMARYLNVERSALSRELSRMRDDGLIEYRKNRFRLL